MTRRGRSRSHWVRSAVVVIGVSLVTLALEHLGAFERFATTGLDAFNILQPSHEPMDVVMIGINDADYKGLFNATSPLKCDPVKQIIEAVAAGGPRVIGVDLDTTSGDFSCLNTLTAERPRIVWAQDAVWDPDPRRFRPLPVLAGVPAIPRGDAVGMVQFPQDRDGVVRRYARELPIDGGGSSASFPWMVVQIACSEGCDSCCEATASHGSDELRLNFAGERFSFPPLSVQHVIDIAKNAEAKTWRESGPLTKRVVLIGGDYREARDTYVTSVGVRSGLQILAQAIESEMHNGGIRALNDVVAFLLDLLCGFLLVAVHVHFKHHVGRALLISLLLMPALALVSSYLSFSTLALWFNFVPVVVSVLIHQMYEHVREYQALKAQT